MKKRIIVLAAVAVCLAGLLVGCSSSNSTSSQSTQSSSSSSVVKVENLAIGTGSTTVTVENQTGSTITGIAIKATTDANYAAGHTFSGFTFEQGKKADISFNPIAVASTSSDKAVTQMYDVKLTTADDSLIGICQIDLVGLTNIQLHFEGGYGFITYTDANGQTVSTKDSAIAIAEAQAATELPPDAEEQSYTEDDTDYTSNDNSYTNTNTNTSAQNNTTYSAPATTNNNATAN